MPFGTDAAALGGPSSARRTELTRSRIRREHSDCFLLDCALGVPVRNNIVRRAPPQFVRIDLERLQTIFFYPIKNISTL
jgi:hypothetical protein